VNVKRMHRPDSLQVIGYCREDRRQIAVEFLQTGDYWRWAGVFLDQAVRIHSGDHLPANECRPRCLACRSSPNMTRRLECPRSIEHPVSRMNSACNKSRRPNW
jgi:hypothetical protein